MRAWKKAFYITVHAVLLALILYQGWLFYALLTRPIAQESAQKVIQPQPAQVESRINIDNLAEAKLFGDIVTATPKLQVSIEQVPPSTRSYRIASIAYQAAGGSSSVVLEVEPGDMAFLRPGDAIEHNVILKDISADAILLETSGRAERIEYVRVRQPVLIKVAKTARADGSAKKADDWTWTAKWNQLSAEDVTQKLGLALMDGRYVVTGESPLLSSWNVAASDRLLAVNGKPLVAGKEIKDQLQPLRQPGTVHLLLENDRRRNLVRWTREM